MQYVEIQARIEPSSYPPFVKTVRAGLQLDGYGLARTTKTR